ncbi:hypothetical protein AC792_14250 [Arthrobacter sp. RIT-PI-e]|nr:hypothetical protein AC792_14250 [Arthrobacter sp. RIT-PI-e]
MCSGVSWSGSHPVARLRLTPVGTVPGADPEASSDLVLEPGTRLSFEIRGTGKYCLGFRRIRGRDDHESVRCADEAGAERGTQCARCFAQDDARHMHDIHRSGIAPAGLKRYLDQTHWLYVATFADGASKVGTAVDGRKRTRLVEQGAVVARYVARADDGRVVRVLEDEVTRSVGLQQAVRSTAKAAALCAPLPPEQLDRINEGFTLGTRGLLQGLNIEGYAVVQEEFRPPASWRDVLAHEGLQPYPENLTRGRHGMTVQHLLGSSALVSIDGTDVAFMADLGQLKGRRLVRGDFSTPVPAVQEALF